MMTGWGEITLGAWVWMAVWVVALVGMVWLLVQGGGGRSRREDPDEILRVRFARGEISQSEFEQARRLLTDDKESRT